MENSNTFYDRLLKDQFNEEEQLDIVSKDPCFIMHMYDTSIKVQEVAISKDPNAIRYIHNQSQHIRWFAVKKGCLLKYIKEPAYNLKYEAININPINIVYVNYNLLVGCNELLDLAIDRGAESIIEKSLEINYCEKSKAVLIALNDRRYKNLLKKKKDDDRKHKYCYFF